MASEFLILDTFSVEPGGFERESSENYNPVVKLLPEVHDIFGFYTKGLKGSFRLFDSEGFELLSEEKTDLQSFTGHYVRFFFMKNKIYPGMHKVKAICKGDNCWVLSKWEGNPEPSMADMLKFQVDFYNLTSALNSKSFHYNRHENTIMIEINKFFRMQKQMWLVYPFYLSYGKQKFSLQHRFYPDDQCWFIEIKPFCFHNGFYCIGIREIMAIKGIKDLSGLVFIDEEGNRYEPQIKYQYPVISAETMTDFFEKNQIKKGDLILFQESSCNPGTFLFRKPTDEDLNIYGLKQQFMI